MATSDGISTEEWDVVHELALSIVNSEEDSAEERLFRQRLLEYLDKLEDKYGRLPSILATRADYLRDDIPGRLSLLTQGYARASERCDIRNQLYIASSLAAIYIEELGDHVNGANWLARAEQFLGECPSEGEREECDRLAARLKRLQR